MHAGPERHAARATELMARSGLLGTEARYLRLPFGPVEDLQQVMVEEDPDLVVVGTHLPGMFLRMTAGSVGETLARGAPHEALVVPDGVSPMAAGVNGPALVSRVLVPLDPDHGRAQQALDAAARFARSVGSEHVVFTTLGPTGDPLPPPEITLPADRGWQWRHVPLAAGNVVQCILAEAEASGVELVVMGTRGHDSLGDALLGSRTEQVLRAAGRPVLVVPWAPLPTIRA